MMYRKMRHYTASSLAITNFATDILIEMGVVPKNNLLIEGGFISGFSDEVDEKYSLIDAGGAQLLPACVDIAGEYEKCDVAEMAEMGIAVALSTDSSQNTSRSGIEKFALPSLNRIDGSLERVFGSLVGFRSTETTAARLTTALSYLKSSGGEFYCLPYDQTSAGDMNEGLISSRLGLAGSASSYEEEIIFRGLIAVRSSGVRGHFLVSTKRGLDLLLSAKREGLDITIFASMSGLIFDESECEGFETIGKTLPHLRTRDDIGFLVENFKHLDFLSICHTKLSLKDKNTSFASSKYGMENGYYIYEMARMISEKNDLKLGEVLSKISLDPAMIFGLKMGFLEGSMARLILLDESKCVPKSDFHPLADRGGCEVFCSVFGSNVFCRE